MYVHDFYRELVSTITCRVTVTPWVHWGKSKPGGVSVVVSAGWDGRSMSDLGVFPSSRNVSVISLEGVDFQSSTSSSLSNQCLFRSRVGLLHQHTISWGTYLSLTLWSSSLLLDKIFFAILCSLHVSEIFRIADKCAETFLGKWSYVHSIQCAQNLLASLVVPINKNDVIAKRGITHIDKLALGSGISAMIHHRGPWTLFHEYGIRGSFRIRARPYNEKGK